MDKIKSIITRIEDLEKMVLLYGYEKNDVSPLKRIEECKKSVKNHNNFSIEDIQFLNGVYKAFNKYGLDILYYLIGTEAEMIIKGLYTKGDVWASILYSSIELGEKLKEIVNEINMNKLNKIEAIKYVKNNTPITDNSDAHRFVLSLQLASEKSCIKFLNVTW